jgi:hypothetical protein
VLHQLRRRVTETLGSASQVVVSTWGPANVQVERMACEGMGLVLYVLVPRTSDLLFNLENHTDVVVTAATWQARGEARLLAPGSHPGQLALASRPEAAWCQIAEIRPTRLQLSPTDGQASGETIDAFEEPPV